MALGSATRNSKSAVRGERCRPTMGRDTSANRAHSTQFVRGVRGTQTDKTLEWTWSSSSSTNSMTVVAFVDFRRSNRARRFRGKETRCHHDVTRSCRIVRQGSVGTVRVRLTADRLPPGRRPGDSLRSSARLREQWRGNPEAVAAAFGVSVESLRPYYAYLGHQDAAGKAFPEDQAPLEDFWVFVDFWKRLGINVSGRSGGFRSPVPSREELRSQAPDLGGRRTVEVGVPQEG